MAAPAAGHIRKALKIAQRLNTRDRKRIVEILHDDLKDSILGVDVLKQLVQSFPSKARARVFLSHSHNDKPFVRSLARKLKANGVGVWLDEGELKIGDSLIERISSVIEETPLLVAVLSRTSVRSNWVKEELHLAMTRQIKKRRVKVLPILKEECKVPGFLAGRLYADFTTPYRRQRNFPLLLQSIVVHSRSKMANSRN